MSAKSDILNKTWTLLPDEEDQDGNREEEEQNEENNTNTTARMDVDDYQINDLNQNHMINNLTTNITNNINLTTDLIDEEMFVDVNQNESYNNNNNNSKLVYNKNIQIINTNTFKKVNLNKTVNLNTTTTLNESLTTKPNGICLKENLNISYNYDTSKISIEMQNAMNRFNLNDLEPFVSLFEENLNGIEFANGDPIVYSNPSSPRIAAKNQNITVNLDTKNNSTSILINESMPQFANSIITPLSATVTSASSKLAIATTTTSNLTHIKKSSMSTASASPLSSSLSASIDNLDKYTNNDEVLSFNPASVPKTFDIFINDLRKSSSTFTINSLNSNSQTNLQQLNTNSMNKRIMTSSIDKDLNKDFGDKQQKYLQLNRLTNLKETSDTINSSINEVDMKTSSPLKIKQFLNKNTNKPIKMNTTIDLNNRNGNNNNLNSNESLNDSEQSFSISQSSSIANFGLAQMNDDEPRTVFNTTYTSWSTNENQLQIEAFNQHRKNQFNTNSTVLMNRTQDMNNNTSKDDLNKTKDIIHDEDLIETASSSSGSGSASGGANIHKTNFTSINRVLNKTQDLPTESNDKLTNLKQTSLAGSNQLRRVSSMQQPASSRPSSIYQKSKLLAPKPSVNITSTNTNNHKNGSSPTMPVSVGQNVKPESKLIASNKMPLNNGNIPRQQIVQPVVSQSLDLNKAKSAIPRVNFGKSTTVTSPVNSNNKSPVSLGANQIQRPNTLTTNNIKPTNQNSNQISNPAININRLSSTSSSSSTSTSSSSSLKENKNHQHQITQIKSPTNLNSKIAALNNNTNQNTISKLKPPSFSANTTTMSLNKASLIPQGNILPNKNTCDTTNVQKSQLKPPSQIPAFKIPTSIPTFRNTTNQVKVYDMSSRILNRINKS